MYLTPAEWVAIGDVEVMVGSLGISGCVNGSIHQQPIVHGTAENTIVCFWRAWISASNRQINSACPCSGQVSNEADAQRAKTDNDPSFV